MSKILIVAAALVATAGVATAADLPRPEPVVAPAAYGKGPVPIIGKLPIIGKAPFGKGPVGKGPVGKGPVVAKY